ncbi:unnamed protein product [Adineta steineri]|uniref:Uncharacterized protein n=1 Tax=Adineta steineri TaxID=433720 RepID=A0A814WNL5_9BILA|nr:unnamed protein product [Adineta steineri]CAF3616973.1 unnamed protein product [Adineta steineri]
MSPESIYNHRLKINVQSSPKLVISKKFHLPSSKFEYGNLHMLTKRKNLPSNEQEQSNHQYIFTNRPVPEPIIHCSVNNQVYDRSMIQKSSTTENIPRHPPLLNSKFCPLSTSSSNKEIKSMDFRPLITYGRRKLGSIPPLSSLIITKKKSLSPMNGKLSNQKPLTRSIPVDIISNNRAMVVSSIIPSSLSYSTASSCSCSSSSSPPSSASAASSTNVGTVFLPIQVTKSQNKNKNNNNNSIKYSNITIRNEGRNYSCQYVQNQSEPQQSLKYQNTRNKVRLEDDIDKSRRISSSSSVGGEGNSYRSTLIMDSNVLRLIRRYDPVTSSPTGIRQHGSLEATRNMWHTFAPQAGSIQSSDSSPFLSHRSLTTTYEDGTSIKQVPTPRLQRQPAIHDTEPSPPPPTIPPPPPSSSISNSLRPILKYASSRSRSEFIVEPRQNESLKNEIELLSNDNTAIYQPLFSTGTKRVCSALSKSVLDLRIQQEQPPIRPPSPVFINRQQNKESFRPLYGRSKSSVGINQIYDDEDDTNDISPLPSSHGSYVGKLKELFVTKSSLDLTNPSINDSIDSNLNRHVNSNNKLDISSSLVKTTPIINSIEPDQRKINKPTIIVQDVTTTPILFNKNSRLKNQKTLDRYCKVQSIDKYYQ